MTNNSKPLTVALVKTGSNKEFPMVYVDKLINSITRNSGRDLKFAILTDNPSQFICDHEVINISKYDLDGYYNKMTLFNNDVLDNSERVVFFDLDTVILANIDDVFDYDGQFAILSNFSRPMGINKCKYGSAIMSLGPGEWRQRLWEEFDNNRSHYLTISKKVGLGDQYIIELIYDRVLINTSEADTWQALLRHKSDNYFRSFKFPVRLDNGPPKDCRIVCFHGKPKCLEMKHLEWMKRHWR